ncbi:MAG: FeoB-associated Cys-rich membrane protein [Paludibacteraceae bacterium]|nr:FeoB-associated Cys-rich membrane protein [Paludibacteraceae bacterium]
MLERIIVIIIIAAAAIGLIYLLWRQTQQPPCEGCADCALRNDCKKLKKK